MNLTTKLLFTKKNINEDNQHYSTKVININLETKNALHITKGKSEGYNDIIS